MPVEGVMKLTKSEQAELQRQANARNARADSARRARLVLLLAEGCTWAEIRAKLDCADSFISRWSQRFEAEGLAGLFARHAGRERYKVTDRLEARVLAWTTKNKPADGSTHWSSRKLAAELGGDMSHMTVTRIWAKHGLKPYRLKDYIASHDRDFETKAAIASHRSSVASSVKFKHRNSTLSEEAMARARAALLQTSTSPRETQP